ncbi:MAG: tetratricopeptide repeat protein [Deltaproteobacteria bacterium]|nr:tetratricopeptide repeat protein [Deltaproteobacteria bacterium]
MHCGTAIRPVRASGVGAPRAGSGAKPQRGILAADGSPAAYSAERPRGVAACVGPLGSRGRIGSTLGLRAKPALCRWWGALLATAGFGLAGSAQALDAEEAFAQAQRQIYAATADIASIQRVAAQRSTLGQSVEQRITDAVLLMGVKDWERATMVLSQVIELYPRHPTALADALNLLGDTYFSSDQFMSARRSFWKIVDRADEPRFAMYRERALMRLVDVALRLRDTGSLDPVFRAIDASPPASAGALAYAKGKGLYAQGKLSAARAELARVDPRGPFAHQARYLVGVIAVRVATPPESAGDGKKSPVSALKGRYAAAIQAFGEVTQLPAQSAQQRHVTDLAWLAIARLFYEMGDYAPAVQAYNRIGRDSPEFGAMLYELAWVYVRQGDFVRAQRALEVLGVAVPPGQDVADASLLRADLMLRAGQFEKSRKVYESVRETYDKMRARVQAFLDSAKDPAAYFQTLSQDQLELFEAGQALPAKVLEWAREGEDGATVFGIIDDVALCRRLIKQSNEMVERLNAVLSSPNRVRALPELRTAAERAVSLLNTVALARLALAQGLDDVEDKSIDPQLRALRTERTKLGERLRLVPVTANDFAKREGAAQRQWNQASQGLQRIELEVDTLQATVNGLRRMLKDSSQSGVVRDPAAVASFMRDLAEQEQALRDYRQQMQELRRMTEAGKVQVGFGDQRFVEDADVRKAFGQILWQELRLTVEGAGGKDLATYGARITPLLRQADAADASIEQARRDLESAIEQRSADLRRVVQQETQNLVEYSLLLGSLDQEAQAVVGQVAMRNFARVRDRLRHVVLRADVGITQEAWEVREEQLMRVQQLRIEKARGEHRLEEELNEVLDDAGGNEEEEK